MRLEHTQEETAPELRYDASTMHKVARLAEQLQSRHQETVTLSEMEAIGTEVGLEPAFLRQALTIVGSQAHQKPAEQRLLWPISAATLCLAWGILAVVWGLMARNLSGDLQRLAEIVLMFIGPAVLSPVVGFLAGKNRLAFMAAVMLVLFTIPGWMTFLGTEGPGVLAYTVLGGSIAGLLGLAGAALRRRFLPPVGSPSRAAFKGQSVQETPASATPSSLGDDISRQEMIHLLFALRSTLEAQQQHRAVLSVDVVDSSRMKLGADSLAVEYSFGEYRRWVEATVRDGGGEIHSAAGDEVMCLFPTDEQAVRAARTLQDGIAAFNTRHNRLSTPFRLRCGLAAGDLAMDENTPLADLHSPVIDRAAALQKRTEPSTISLSAELTDAAVQHLGELAPLAEPVLGESAFCWTAPDP